MEMSEEDIGKGEFSYFSSISVNLSWENEFTRDFCDICLCRRLIVCGSMAMLPRQIDEVSPCQEPAEIVFLYQP